MRYLALGDVSRRTVTTRPVRFCGARSAWWEAGVECDLRNPAVNGYTTDDLIREELPWRGVRPTS